MIFKCKGQGLGLRSGFVCKMYTYVAILSKYNFIPLYGCYGRGCGIYTIRLFIILFVHYVYSIVPNTYMYMKYTWRLWRKFVIFVVFNYIFPEIINSWYNKSLKKNIFFNKLTKRYRISVKWFLYKYCKTKRILEYSF